MLNKIYLQIFIMAGVTYLIRMLPLTLIQKEIKNRFFRSFLYYVPYATLAAMTFPAILSASSSRWAALAGFLTAVWLAYKEKSLLTVALAACGVVFVWELLLPF